MLFRSELCCSYIDVRFNNDIMNIDEFLETNKPYVHFILEGLDHLGLFKLYDDNDSDWSELKSYLLENNIKFAHRRTKKLTPIKIVEG